MRRTLKFYVVASQNSGMKLPKFLFEDKYKIDKRNLASEAKHSIVITKII